MNYQVNITVTDLHAMLDLKGDGDFLRAWPVLSDLAFPTINNTATERDGMSVYWIGKQHWLVRAPLDQEPAFYSIAKSAEAIDEISATIVSDAMSFFSLNGHDADQVMSIASPLDVHPSVFPKNGVTYTEAFGIKALIIRCEGGYEIGVDRSYFDMIGDCFGHALGD